jgi:hypothetical protein
MFAKAIEANISEREAFLLPQHKQQARQVLGRARSQSCSHPDAGGAAAVGEGEDKYLAGQARIRSHSTPSVHQHMQAMGQSLTPPEFAMRLAAVSDHELGGGFLRPPERLDVPLRMRRSGSSASGSALSFAPMASQRSRRSREGSSESRRSSSPATQEYAMAVRIVAATPPTTVTRRASMATGYLVSPMSVVDKGNAAASEPDLGAWCRYPSHTRGERTGSAGPADRVDARDFVCLSGGRSGEGDSSNEKQTRGLASPGTEKLSPRATSSSGGSSRKRIGRPGLLHQRVPAASRGVEMVRQAGRFLGAPSMDYIRHGFARRMMVAMGGEAGDPDLEMVREVWAPRPLKFARDEHGEGTVVTATSAGLAEGGVDGAVEEIVPGRTSGLDASGEHTAVVDPPNCIRGSPTSTHSRRGDELSPAGSGPETRSDGRLRRRVAGPPTAESIRRESWSTSPEIQIGGEAVGDVNFGTAAGSAETVALLAAPTTSTLPTPPSVLRVTPRRHRGMGAARRSAGGSSPGAGASPAVEGGAVTGAHGRNTSVMSIRQSSYDVLQMLAEVEEQERRRRLGLLPPGVVVLAAPAVEAGTEAHDY